MIKRVSPNERLYLACESLYPPFLIQIRVIGEGSIDPGLLQMAVDEASDANPGARLVLRGKKWIDSHQSPQVRQSPLTDSLIHTPILNSSAEVVVDRNEILFRVFHGIMDARGLLLFIEDVFRRLNGKPARGALSTMTDREAVLTKKVTREKPEARYPSLANGETTWTFAQVPLEPNLTARLAQAITRITNGPSKFMIPVDLRPFFPDVQTTGNFSNPIFVEALPSESAAKIQAKIVRKIADGAQFATSTSDQFLNYVPLGIQRVAVRKAQESMDRRNRYVMTAVLSNLGKINLNSFSTPTFKAQRVISLPLDTPFCPLTIIMTEHAHGAELAISSRSKSLADEITQALTHEMRGPTQTIPQFFELFHASDRVALSQGERRLTYRELDDWSTSVAAKLPRVSRIAVELNHSIELIVALLAIWKSGAAFVPIDPTLPRERRDLIAESAQHVIRDVNDEEPFPDHSRKRFVPGELAYVIFTSGSTGRPKGVEVSHRNFMNYLGWALNTYGPPERAALFTSIGFDLTLTSIFLPLISQGEIRIYDQDPFVGFKNLEAENVVTFLKATPSHLRVLKPMSRVKTLIVGGEQLPTSLAAPWKHANVFNEYGPTETTVGITCARFNPDDTSPSVPIGRPIANTVTTIVNGELVIEGDSVANGYLESTRFQGRYRTGDLVDVRDDGQLLYLGRVDRQLKMNGIRIEPAEIEEAILANESVTEVVVGLNRSHQLVAFYKSEGPVDLHLESKLSKSVIPAILERRSEFPLSPNGKIDFDQTLSAAKTASHRLDRDQLFIRDQVAQILNQPAESLSLQGPTGLDSLSLVILLDRIGRPEMFQKAHEFAHDPTIEKIAATLTSLGISEARDDDHPANPRPR